MHSAGRADGGPKRRRQGRQYQRGVDATIRMTLLPSQICRSLHWDHDNVSGWYPRDQRAAAAVRIANVGDVVNRFGFEALTRVAVAPRG